MEMQEPMNEADEWKLSDEEWATVEDGLLDIYRRRRPDLVWSWVPKTDALLNGSVSAQDFNAPPGEQQPVHGGDLLAASTV